MTITPQTRAVGNLHTQIPHEPEEIAQREIEEFRQMSFAERGRRLAIACRSAARLDRSRQMAGLPNPAPDPWPESTWEYLKQQAARYARTAGNVE